MANKQDITEILMILQTAYPQTEMGDYTPQLYLELLQDIPGDILKQAVLHHVSRSPWYPKVSEIRRSAVELQINAPAIPNAYEAWQMVCTAIVKYGRYGRPQFDHPMVEKTVDVMGWVNLCMSTNQVADRARFVDAYESLKEREIENATILPQVKDLANKLSSSVRAELPEEVE